MLNGMERALEKHLPERDRRWPEKKGIQGSDFRIQEGTVPYKTAVSDSDLAPWNSEQSGYPDPQPEPRTPNPEPRALNPEPRILNPESQDL